MSASSYREYLLPNSSGGVFYVASAVEAMVVGSCFIKALALSTKLVEVELEFLIFFRLEGLYSQLSISQ